MCTPSQPLPPVAAVATLERALDELNGCDVGSLPAAVQAEVLKGLERVESRYTAARARTMAAFDARGGYESDGQGSARVWLVWQTRVTAGAAGGAIGWMNRLAAHPVVARALAAGQMSASWAKQVCAWSDQLPESRRQDADQILAAAAAGGARLSDLAGLAQEMHERSAGPSRDDDGGFADRYLRLGITLGGAGRADADLTPGCAAALAAVLEALGKKAGPEDTRTGGQRRHDALEEACRRLIASGMLPGRAGQPTQIQVHMTLSQLRRSPGAATAEAAWLATRTEQPGWLSGPAADAAGCDATLVPVVSGHVDWSALDRLTGMFVAAYGARPTPPHAAADRGTLSPVSGAHPCRCTCGGCGCPAPVPLSPATRRRLRASLLALAATALSGPGGLAAHLRAGLNEEPLTSVSLPLDIGAPTAAIPAHLRRAATTRHPTCAFPGCDQPASVCDIHHLIPRAAGGATALHNLVPLCSFHHLTVIHRWGWSLQLNPDGTTTATSPDGRTLHSHGPPSHDPPSHDPPSHGSPGTARWRRARDR